MRRRDVVLGGKELFVYYRKSGGGIVGGCTNKRILSKRTGIDYNTLMWNFTRKGRCYYENEFVVILKLHTSDIEKGAQSMVRKGKGGMERFMERYVIKKRDIY
jgi:hypothetical protein